MQAAGMPDRGGPFDARSCAHAGFDPAEILSCRGHWLHQGQKLDLDRAEYRAKGKNFTGHKFWARGYFVSTVGRDEETIRAYIRNQELQDRQMDQLALIP